MRRVWKEVDGQHWEIWKASGSRRWDVELKFSKAPRGRCRWCGKTIMKGGVPNLRRRWHEECQAEFHFQLYPQEARAQVYRRDLGVCAMCGIDTKELKAELRKPAGREMVRSLGFDTSTSLWQADHIVRVADGGPHAMENLQTACQICHKTKTADENRKTPKENS